MFFYWFGIYYEHISFRSFKILIILRPLRTAFLLLKIDLSNMLLWLLGVQDQPIPFFWLATSIDLRLFTANQFLQIDIRQMVLKLLWVENKVISCRVSFWLNNGLDQCFFLLPGHVNNLNVWVNHIVLHCIFSNLWAFPLDLQILFKSIELFPVGLILAKCHIFGQNYIFGNFSPYFIKIAIIKQPVFREEYLIRKMDGFNIGWIFVQRGWYVSINCSIRWKIDSIICFFYLNAVVLPIILFRNLCEFYYSNIVSFLHL